MLSLLLIYLLQMASVYWQVFDDDGDGFIEDKDLIRVMAAIGQDLGPDEVRGMLEQADTDDDGKILFAGNWTSQTKFNHIFKHEIHLCCKFQCDNFINYWVVWTSVILWILTSRT